MVDFAVSCAKGKRGTRDEYRWSKLVLPEVPLLGPLRGEREEGEAR